MRAGGMKIVTSIVFLVFLCPTSKSVPISVDPQGPQKPPRNYADTFEGIVKVNEGQGDFYQGDIVFPKQRNAIADKSLKWDNAVPYVITAQFSFETRSKIRAALQELEVRTCIKFVERSAEADYLQFEMNSGCYSNVGKIGGKQVVSIGVGCEYHRTIIHETLHALGFWHEQSRTDRDDYVKIVWEVISEGREHNFEKYEADTLDTQGVPYDYNSILHYGDKAFSSNGSKTIIALQEGGENMGKLDRLSQIDLQQVNLLYGCRESLDNEGYTIWSEWSECDSNCKRQRQRFCDGDKCTIWGQVETQTSDCDVDCEEGLDPDCGNPVLSGVTGSVASPLFPHSYKPNAFCTSTIKVPEGARVQLSFQAMDVEDYNGACHYDFVHVYDGASDKATKIGTYCSSGLPETIFASGNVMTIEFTSDSSVEKGGFYAKFYAVAAPVHVCEFEDEEDLCGWEHKSDAEVTFQWHSGPTQSIETGPSVDHTFGNEAGHYLYLESSSPAQIGDKAQITSQLFQLPWSKYCFSFWYNMYGINCGSLNAYLVVNNTVLDPPVASFSGGKTINDWYHASLDMVSKEPFRVAIEAVRGDGYKGDIAIDDVKLDVGSCA